MSCKVVNIFENVRDKFVITAVTLNSENTYGLYKTILNELELKKEMVNLYDAREMYLGKKNKYVTDLATSVDDLLYNRGSLDTEFPIKENLLDLSIYYIDNEGNVHDVRIKKENDHMLSFSKDRYVGDNTSIKARLYLQGMIRKEDTLNEMKYTTLDIDRTDIQSFYSNFESFYIRWPMAKKIVYNKDGSVRKVRKNMREVKKETEHLSKLEKEYSVYMEKQSQLGIKFDMKKDERFTYVCVEFGIFIDESGTVFEITMDSE